VFQSLPIAFHTMPAGSLVGFAFFVLVFFAALTSSISLLEAVVAWAKRQFNWSRPVAAWVVGGVIFLVGVACALSLNIWSDVRILGGWSLFADANIFDTSWQNPVAGCRAADRNFHWLAGGQKTGGERDRSGRRAICIVAVPGRMACSRRCGPHPVIRPVS